MAKVFDRCPDSVRFRAEALIAKYHPDLKAAEVSIDYLFVAHDGEGPALKLHGVAALAIARIIGSKDRAAGRADCEILIDRDRYIDATEEQQDALLDHELQHFAVKRDKDGHYATDDQHRPKLKMRHHDWDFGWFDCIARRHGNASCEVQQARIIFTEGRQTLFEFVRDMAAAEE